MTVESDRNIHLFYIQALRARAGHVSYSIANATATALIKRHPELNLEHIDIENTAWARSLFVRLGFTKKQGTTGKVPIPEEVKKEIEITYLHNIVDKVERYNIPHSLVVNLDQTPLKIIPVSKRTLAPKGESSVPLVGLTDKRSITATFATSLDGKFLPLQLIYGGKTEKSLPPVIFPESFSLSANEKHYSNETEAKST